MNIYRGTIEDLPNILKIEERVFPESPWNKEMLRNALQHKPDRQTWILESNKQIIGYLMARYGLNEVHLINIVIDTPFQMQGIGRVFLNQFLDQIPSQSTVFLEVKRSNFPALNIYLDSGFQEIGVHDGYYSDGEDAIVMKWHRTHIN